MDVRGLRRTVRLTQIELAQSSGVDRVKISLAECGYLRLSADEKAAITRAVLGVAEKRFQQVRKVVQQQAVALAG